MWFKAQDPARNWFDTATSRGIWHSWREFDAFFVRALRWDLQTPEWRRFRVWQKQFCRYRWTAGRYLTAQNPSGIISPELMESLVFAALTRGSYECGDVFTGEPPDWCQLARAPGGGWAAICFNPIAEGCHCLACDKGGKAKLCRALPAGF